MPQKLIAQGAEAKIILSDSTIRAGGQKAFIIKNRIKKSYRISELDNKIRKSRTKKEIKLLTKASKIINAPIPLTASYQSGGREGTPHTKIKMPFIDGKKLSEHLDKFPLAKQKKICKQIGEDIAKLHNENIIHGDLTTSNMILVEKLPAHLSSQIKKKEFNKNSEKINLSDNKSITKKSGEADFEATNKRGKAEPIIFFIDFGLGFISRKTEDKAVDLHLLKQALEAKHYKNWEALYKEVEKAYKNSLGRVGGNANKVLERLRAVEKRGRYKG